MKWAGHVALVGERGNAYKNFGRKVWRGRPLGRPRSR